jgi:hypothetical protein
MKKDRIMYNTTRHTVPYVSALLLLICLLMEMEKVLVAGVSARRDPVDAAQSPGSFVEHSNPFLWVSWISKLMIFGIHHRGSELIERERNLTSGPAGSLAARSYEAQDHHHESHAHHADSRHPVVHAGSFLML